MPRLARKITQFTQDEIKHLFRVAHFAYRDAGLSIRKAPRMGDFARLLLITPKKSGNAPQRNKFRRQLKAVFYEERLYELPFDFIVQCSKDCQNKTFQDFKDIFLALKSQLSPNKETSSKAHGLS